MTLYTQVSSNRFKTAFYLVLFSLLFLGLAYVVSLYYGSVDIVAIAAVIVIIQGIASYWFSDSIALVAAKARPIDGDPRGGRIHRLTENLCITAGLPVPRIFLIDDTAMNAFATGRGKDHAAIAVTTGLADRLDDNELAGVIAHELSHIGNEDIRLMGMVMVMAGLIALISDIFLRNMFWGRRRDNGNNDGGAILIVIALVLAILAPIAATLIQLAISRKREYMADATGVLITRYPEGLIGALKKIGGDEEPLEVANRGNAFMYFSNPLHSQWFSGLFSTHPSIESRIEALSEGSGMSMSA